MDFWREQAIENLLFSKMFMGPRPLKSTAIMISLLTTQPPHGSS